MIQKRKWAVAEPDGLKVEKVSGEAGISPLLAKVLASRGIEDGAEIRKFIDASMEELHDPYLLKDMDKAVEGIVRALEEHRRISIYGDYDVDGVTSTSILYNFLKEQGADVDYYVPDRFNEGYGLSMEGIDRLKQQGTSLVITVDCGTTAFEEVEHIKRSGMEVIITDHHECMEEVPAALAVVNPCRQDCGYPFKLLAGAGVAYKLIHALCLRWGMDGRQNEYLDLVAMGTVADVVSLLGENRSIVRHGLAKFSKTANAGLKVLLECCELKNKPVSSWTVGFVLAPRINAAGRMGSAGRAIELFTTQDLQEAEAIALELIEKNKLRQEVENSILERINGMVEADGSIKDARVLVLAGEGWHRGVIGIVASRVAEKYNKPCFLISVEDGIGRGSARSRAGFDLFKALSACTGVLEGYGGHELAAGLTIREENIGTFREMINGQAEQMLAEGEQQAELRIDAAVCMEELTVDGVRQLELLAPFGTDNPAPLFVCGGLKIGRLRTVGDNRHLKLTLEDGNKFIDAIGFNMGEWAGALNSDDLIDVACQLEINHWNGSEKIQMNMKDLRLSDLAASRDYFFYSLDKAIDFTGSKSDNSNGNFFKMLRDSCTEGLTLQAEHIIPERKDFVTVFQYVKSNGSASIHIPNLLAFSRKLSRDSGVEINYFKLKKILEVFNELDIMSISPVGDWGMLIRLQEGMKAKKKLEDSLLYVKLQGMRDSI